MSLTVILSFVVTTIISALMIPLVIKAGNQLGIVAHMNKRTVHKHEIARIGGYAIYLSSLIGSALFLKADHQINAIMVAGFIIFMVGLYDDSHDLSPKVKLIFEVIAALIVIVYGEIYIKGFGYFPSDAMTFLSGVVTLFWIVGITNAINLIDGLDGLSAGISIIVLVTISMTSLLSGRSDIASLSLILAGSIMGFLFFNFHPAKIFMGDTGSLAIGGAIATIAIILEQPLLIIIVGGVYVFETLSVIIQVTSFKLTGKRVFKMAPVHHHFEKCGWSEVKIVTVFSLITAVLCLIGFLAL